MSSEKNIKPSIVFLLLNHDNGYLLKRKRRNEVGVYSEERTFTTQMIKWDMETIITIEF